MEVLTFQYSAWYIILCLALGLIFALVLYFRDKSFREQSRWLNWLLGALRFLVVSLICILLLSPLLRSSVTETQKPLVLLVQDESESVPASMDEDQLEKYKQDFRALSNELSQKYEVKEYAFGNEFREGINFTFEDKVTNLSEMFQQVYDLYSNQNLGAIVLATDGIFNEGSNPLYSSGELAVPIYSVALGDTTIKKDLTIRRVFHNKIAYLDDRFSIEVDISAGNCAGSETKLVVSKIEGGSSRKLEEIPISINQNDFFTTREIILDANQSGVQRYRLRVTSIGDEISTVNNVKDIFVDVLDARQKVLLLINSPHPDINALKQSISNNKNYEVEVGKASEFKGQLGDFDLVVLHQLPSTTNNPENILKELNTRKIPRLFILGTQSDLGKFNDAQNLLTVTGDGNNINEVQASIGPAFSLFTISEDLEAELPRFAPLIAPFGDFVDNANAQVFLYQKIGKIDTKYPLLLFGEQNDIRVGILAAEGLWKWRLFDFLQRQNHDVFEEVMEKMIQYLTVKDDKRKFRVSIVKNIFKENEAILLDAELYNDSYELINEPDAGLTIINGAGKEFNYTFNRSNRAYKLDAGYFPVGSYSYKGTVMNSGKQLTHAGQFSVEPIQLEAYQTSANHRLLNLLSNKFGGEVVRSENLTSLGATITGKDIKPVIYETTKTRPVIHIKWIFFLLLLLLTLEWFFRRYYGRY